ncbi:MAG: gamma-glutamyltransferase [Deltaproteobacteria bacterium]|nr:gamma-glutamyltransferase [Deltaproteobacteria bacterium]
MGHPYFASRRAAGGPGTSGRSAVLARRGIVCTSQPLASQAGLAVLRDGGNAFDAAITAVAVQCVVEPYNTGVGGDCFAIVWPAREGRLRALNGSGRAPAEIDIAALRAQGDEMPWFGAATITVPGAVDAWHELLSRYGTRSLRELLAPAIAYAEDGFAVSEIVSNEWDLVVRFGLLRNDDARRCFAPDGAGPRPGRIVRLPELARSLRLLAEGGRDAFYGGELAERLVAALRNEGCALSLADLAEHRSTWVEPIGIDYRGYRLCEVPPNTQGITALIALGILQHHDLGALRGGSAEALHLVIEAVKLALADRAAHVADAEHMRVPVEALLDASSLRRRAAEIDLSRASEEPRALAGGSDTVTLVAADAEGNVVTLINSLYGAFGSGLVAGDTGIALQNRGRGFVLDPAHPNCIAPRKRPFHTLCPAMLLANGRPAVALGVMGGDVQAQAHVQVVTSLVDHGRNVQEALDATRFHALGGAHVAFEEDLPVEAREALALRGHRIEDPLAALARGGFGGGQAIAIDAESGVLWGGSDRRKDGAAAGF